MTEPTLQLIDGPDELLGTYTAEQLEQLVHRHQIPAWSRILDLSSMATKTVADLWPDLSTSETASRKASAPPTTPSGDTATMPMSMTDDAEPTRDHPPTGRELRTDEITKGTVWDDITFAQRIGQGGMGMVYRATINRTGVEPLAAAIKLLPHQAEHDPGSVTRFQREGQALAEIDSPHVVKVYRTDVHQGRHYIAMELVEGRSLAEVIDSGFRPTPDEACTWIGQAARGLWAAAKKGIVHRDIKPGNILLAKDNSIRLTDFGIARLNRNEVTNLTMTGAIVGTATYLSPEQAQSQPCDHRSDLYSLGIVFYELLTGKVPFESGNLTQLLRMHCETPPPPIETHLPPIVKSIVHKLLQKNPADRYQSAMDLVRDLTAATAEHMQLTAARPGGDLAATPTTAAQRNSRTAALAPRPTGSGGIPALPVIIGTLVLILAGGGGFWHLSSQPVRTTPEPTVPVPTPTPTPPVVTPEPEPEPTIDPQVVRETLRANYFTAVRASDWTEAHRLASAYHRDWPERADADQITIPVVIDAKPPARVRSGNELLGTTPLTIHLRAEEGRTLTLQAAGHAPTRLQIDPAEAILAPELPPLPELRWVSDLPGRPLQALTVAPRLALTTDSVICLAHGDRGGIRTWMPTNTVFGAPQQLGHGADTLVAVLDGGLVGIDPSTALTRWQIADASRPPASGRPAIAAHELVENAHKAYVASGRRLSTALLHHRRGMTLATTALADDATATPAVIAVDVGLAVLGQPIGARLHLFDASTVVEDQPLTPITDIDLGGIIEVAPVPRYHNDIPCLITTTRGGGTYIVDVRPDTEPGNRLLANWFYPRSASGPLLTAGDTILVTALKNNLIIAVDLADGGTTVWQHRPDRDLVGPPSLLGDTIVITENNGMIRGLAASDGTERWAITTTQEPALAAQVVGNLVLLPTEGLLLGLEPKS